MKYVYVIERADDGSFPAYVPDLPGCTTSADTMAEVRANIKYAVDSYLESLRDHNEPVPAPDRLWMWWTRLEIQSGGGPGGLLDKSARARDRQHPPKNLSNREQFPFTICLVYDSRS